MKTTKLKGIDLEEIAELNQNYNPKFVRYTDSMLFRLNYVFYAYLLKEKDIAYLDFRSFQLMLDKGEEQKVKQKLDSLFAYLKQKEIKNLIIDIRENGGGEDYCTEVLMDNLTNTAWSWGKAKMKFSKEQKEMYKKIFINDADSPEDSLKNYKKYIEPENGTIKELEVEIPEISEKKYEGNVFLLTGSFTYSAAMSFAAICKCHRVATLIGEETGGASHNFTSSLSFELPNTKVGFSVPHREVESPCEADYYHGVIPDYEVIPTTESKIEGRDAVLEYTIDLIKKGGNNSNSGRKAIN